MKMRPHRSKALPVGLLAGAPLLLQAVSRQQVQAAMLVIGAALGINQTQVGILGNSELLASLAVLPIAGKLGGKFGPAPVQSVGLLLSGVFGLLFAIPSARTSFWLALALKVGFGLSIGIAAPMGLGVSAWLCSAGQYRKAAVVQGVIVPLGVILSSVCTSFVTEATWHVVNVAVGVVGLLEGALCIILYPPSIRRRQRLNINVLQYSVYIAGVSLVVFGLLCIPISQGAIIWLSCAAVVAGLGLLVGFCFMDKRARVPFVPAELRTRRHLSSFARLFVGAMLDGGGRYFFAAQLIKQFLVSQAAAGGYSALSALGIVAGALLSGLGTQKMRPSKLHIFFRLCGAVSGAFGVLIGMEAALFPRLWLRVVAHGLETTAWTSCFAALQIYATQGTPDLMAMQGGAVMQLMQLFGQAVGVGAAVGLQETPYSVFFWVFGALFLALNAVGLEGRETKENEAKDGKEAPQPRSQAADLYQIFQPMLYCGGVDLEEQRVIQLCPQAQDERQRLVGSEMRERTGLLE